MQNKVAWKGQVYFSIFLLVKRMAQAPMDSGHGLVHANHTVVGRPVVLIKDGCVWDPWREAMPSCPPCCALHCDSAMATSPGWELWIEQWHSLKRQTNAFNDGHEPCAGKSIVFFRMGLSKTSWCRMRRSIHSWIEHDGLAHFILRFIDLIVPLWAVCGNPMSRRNISYPCKCAVW